MNALVDNDVLVKGACYGLLAELVATVSGPIRCGLLGAARFVVPKAIGRQKLQREPAVAQQAFQAFLAQHDLVEPTSAEEALAAELEAAAQALALNLDAGESQLAAMLISRAVPALLTGDKRAVIAMDQLFEAMPAVQVLAGRIHCLEQAVRRLLASADAGEIRQSICAEPRVDKALTICFSCSSPEVSPPSIAAALDSYIADLRAAAPRVLAE